MKQKIIIILLIVTFIFSFSKLNINAQISNSNDVIIPSLDDDFDDDKVIVCFDENFGGVNKEVSKDIFTLSSIKKIISNLTVNLKNKIKKIKDIGIEKISDLSYIENP